MANREMVMHGDLDQDFPNLLKLCTAMRTGDFSHIPEDEATKNSIANELEKLLQAVVYLSGGK